MKGWYLKALFTMFALLCAEANAAPVAYSVNSDQPLGDTLHTIDLSNGNASPVGTGVTSSGVLRRDVEGLAMAPDLSLWGVDEEKLKLFEIETKSGTVVAETERDIDGISDLRGNDFGLTFTCDGTLYGTSVITQSLYSLDRSTGKATVVGGPGNLKVNISAIAAYGSNPVRMYGLGNGSFGAEGPLDNRSLYEIDPNNGTASLVGSIGPPELIPDYTQAGLGFDLAGNLWAITDRSDQGLPSQILQIETISGEAKVMATTSIIGFESLAVAPPADCGSSIEPPQPEDSLLAPIPALQGPGRLFAILLLGLTGLLVIRQRLF